MSQHESPDLGTTAVPPPPPGGPIETPRPRRGLIAGAIVVALAVVAGVVAFVAFQGGESAGARPLALAFTEGQSETYAIHQTMDGQITGDALGEMPLAMDVTQVVTWEVTSVDGDGVATVEVTVSEMSGSVNGIEVPAAPEGTPPFELQIAPDGRVVSAGGLSLGGGDLTQGFGFPGMGQLTPILPDEGDRVAPGDSWEKEFSQEFPFGEGTIEFTAESTYERNEDVDGREAAVIVTEMTVPMNFTLNYGEVLDEFGGELPSGATGLANLENATVAFGGEGAITQTSWVDLDARELLRTESSGDFDMSMEFTGVPMFEGTIGFTGTFSQDLERR